jgi:hypothetical protein
MTADDFDPNDPSIFCGIVEAEERIKQLAAEGVTVCKPPFVLPTASVAEIRTSMSRAITRFFARRFTGGDPPRVLLGGSTGTGKSEELGMRLPDQIVVDRAHRRPHRVIVAVPAHRLGKQLAERYRAMAANRSASVSVEVYEGRGDPFDDGEPTRRDYLCEDLLAVKLAIQAGAQVNSAVCGSLKKDEERCRFRENCGYFQQFARCGNADILLVAHNFIFEPLPQPLLGNVGAVIVEEDFTAHGTGTVTLPLDTFSPEMLAKYPVLYTRKNQPLGKPDNAATEQLRALFAKLDRVITELLNGQHPNAAVDAAGLTKEDCEKARKLSWKRRVRDEMVPGMPTAARINRREKCAYNTVLPRIAACLHALAEIAPEAGNTYPSVTDDTPERIWVHGRKLFVPGLKQPAEWLAELPVIIASATARADRVRKFFPTLEHVTPPAPALPHQRVHQILGAFGKSATAKKIDDIVTDVRLKALGKSALVIVHQCQEAAFQGLPGIVTRHHGDVAGDDDYGDVDMVFQIGGPFPDQDDIALAASAETSHRIPRANPVRTPCAGLMVDGIGVQFDRLAYTDPAAQAAHTDVYDTSFVQGGLGRGRGLNRGPDTSLDVYICGNVELPVPLTSIKRWRRPSRLDKMFLAGHVPTNSVAMHELYPEPGMFPFETAADKARERWGGVAGMRAKIRELAERAGEVWDELLCQPEGRGHKARPLFVRHDQIAAAESAVEAAFHRPCKVWNLEAPLHRPPGWIEETDISRKRQDLFLGMSESSERTAYPKTPRRPLPRSRPPPGQGKLI